MCDCIRGATSRLQTAVNSLARLLPALETGVCGGAGSAEGSGDEQPGGPRHVERCTRLRKWVKQLYHALARGAHWRGGRPPGAPPGPRPPGARRHAAWVWSSLSHWLLPHSRPLVQCSSRAPPAARRGSRPAARHAGPSASAPPGHRPSASLARWWRRLARCGIQGQGLAWPAARACQRRLPHRSPLANRPAPTRLRSPARASSSLTSRQRRCRAWTWAAPRRPRPRLPT